MAQHTKQPDVLRELFCSAGDDPFVIAELADLWPGPRYQAG